MSGNDKRRFTRVAFDTEVIVHHGGRAWPSDLIDLSLRGLLVVRPDGFEIGVGSELDVDIVLNEEVSIDVHGTLMHRTGDRLGLRIDRIGMESLMHLRRLLELNLGDPELFERELSGLSG